MTKQKPLLIYVCAYHLEAIAIIEHYNLKKDMSINQFAYYRGDNIALIETGAGKQNAAITCAYVAGRFDIKQSAWLNIGIAGHRSLPIGQGILCNKVTDNETLINYYPDMRFKGELSNKALLTVQKPEQHYNSDNLYDMEASGFFHSSSRFSTLEHIHSYKIISDNVANPLETFKKDQTRELVNHCIAEIDRLSTALIEAIKKYQETYRLPEEYFLFIQNHHFSVTQQEQLKLLLRHWYALSTRSLLESLPSEHRDSKQLLNNISIQIDKLNTMTGEN